MRIEKGTKIIRSKLLILLSALLFSFTMFIRMDTVSAQGTISSRHSGTNAIRSVNLPSQPQEIQYEPTGMTLEIPSLSVSTEIVVAPFIDGEFSVYWLGYTAGLLEGTALPGQGPSVIAAHNHLSGAEAGPFVMLQFMNKGDKIFVMDKTGKLQSFTVYASEKIAEDDVAGLISIASGHDRPLLLLTCEDERPEGGYANRRIIAADPN